MTDARGGDSRGRLRELFSRVFAVVAPPLEGTIAATPIPGYELHRLGRTRDGAVCLVISATSSSKAARPDVRLQNLTIQRRVLCDVVRPTGEREQIHGSVISCCAQSQDLRGFFLDLFDQALSSIGRNPSEEQIDSWLEQATSLFAELEAPSAREIRGLWGELLVISEARDPTAYIRRWHECPDERFDFLSGSFALEVKTCTDLERIHLFSLSQIRPSADIEVVVASIPVRLDPHGVSVVGLLSAIEARVTDAEALKKLRQTAFHVGGASLLDAPQRFDRRAASDGLRLMRASQIPGINEPLSTEILDVRLHVRCCDVPGEDLSDVVEVRFR
jgi:hypothetical protein